MTAPLLALVAQHVRAGKARQVVTASGAVAGLVLELPPLSRSRARALWSKVPGVQHPTCGARWTHGPSSVVVRHCGHPTANRPYEVIAPDGWAVPELFRRLADAQVFVEAAWGVLLTSRRQAGAL